MLFIDPNFLFIFLPITVFGFYFTRRAIGPDTSLLWLFAASLFFYGWNYPPYVLLILGSYTVNYLGSKYLRQTQSKALLILMISLNLGYIGFFKYFGFFVDNVSLATGHSFNVMRVMLPLGISFYTFQQIPYLVAAYNRDFHDIGLLKYCVVNSFFPHLIAGPIIWHKEIAPQLVRGRDEPIDTAMATLGLVFFSIGLFKKVMLADNIAYLADDVFNAAGAHAALTFCDAWLGGIAYGLQIYFDFSGYSEMAIGLALLFGIRFPINFFSPYKATSIIEFWRRWHMTMTRFFQEFVYVPLQFAVSRRSRSPASRYAVIMVMMLLVGLWHGAGWTWILWGVVHGALLCWNHLWRTLRKSAGIPYEAGRSISLIGRTASWALTFLAVSAVWVLFRAPDAATAATLYRSMFFVHGVVLPQSWGALLPASVQAAAGHLHIGFAGDVLGAAVATQVSSMQILGLASLIAFVALAPNTIQILRYYSEGRTFRAFNSAADTVADFDWTKVVRQWRPSWGWAAAAATLFVVSLTSIADDTSKTVFIYFNF